MAREFDYPTKIKILNLKRKSILTTYAPSRKCKKPDNAKTKSFSSFQAYKISIYLFKNFFLSLLKVYFIKYYKC